MTHVRYVRVHISEFHAKLNTFRYDGEYCDVTIEVQEKTFQCHRLVLAASCEYFNDIFSGNVKENTAEHVSLQNIDASTFEQMLEFFYTGEILITDNNVYNLLRVSDILSVSCIENLCVEYIEENVPLTQAIDLFLYAHLQNKNSLINVLSRYIVENIEQFLECDKFFEIPYDDLYNLLRHYWYSASKENVLLDIIISWVRYSRDERTKYLDQLLQLINFENISPSYIKTTIMKSMCVDEDAQSIVCTDVDPCVPKNKPSLHVCLQNSEDKKIEIFSKHGLNNNWTVSCSMEVNSVIRKYIPLDNYLYYLDCIEDDLGESQMIFCANSSFSSMDSGMRLLKSPPLVFSDFSMCNVENDIYLYNYNFSGANRKTSTSSFTKNEIDRSIYVYNRDLDEWFPAPAMKTDVRNSCMTAYNNVVYLIGGKRPDLSDVPVPTGYVQALDCRTSRWQELPRSNLEHENVSCCVHKGKIYVPKSNCPVPKSNCAFRRERQMRLDALIPGSKKWEMEVYDPVAGKWDIIEPIRTDSSVSINLVSYEDLLWVTSINYSGFNVRTYNADSQKWKSLPSLVIKEAGSITDHINSNIQNAFVFRPFDE